jgi:hypothetical protein
MMESARGITDLFLHSIEFGGEELVVDLERSVEHVIRDLYCTKTRRAEVEINVEELGQ